MSVCVCVFICIHFLLKINNNNQNNNDNTFSEFEFGQMKKKQKILYQFINSIIYKIINNSPCTATTTTDTNTINSNIFFVTRFFFQFHLYDPLMNLVMMMIIILMIRTIFFSSFIMIKVFHTAFFVLMKKLIYATQFNVKGIKYWLL